MASAGEHTIARITTIPITRYNFLVFNPKGCFVSPIILIDKVKKVKKKRRKTFFISTDPTRKPSYWRSFGVSHVLACVYIPPKRESGVFLLITFELMTVRAQPPDRPEGIRFPYIDPLHDDRAAGVVTPGMLFLWHNYCIQSHRERKSLRVDFLFIIGYE
jgi:hypothetical protein